MIDHLLQSLMATSYWEIAAMLLSITYLLLAMRQNSLCWFAAFASTSIYLVIFWEVNLLMDSILQFYYLIMAVYGLYIWQFSQKEKTMLRIQSWSFKKHSIFIISLACISLILGFMMDNYTQADFPYIDSATTCFSVFTTYLVAQKVLENWLYWIVIDSVSVYIYFEKSLILTAFLFVLYTVLVIFGYFQWKSEHNRATPLTQPAYS
ncbi:nicotinamide riboside transporter PnuC [Algicola sagamiensis]|uniref:nicotinamide riboside transporter PnuC n=1 Tax=Algicola sagamiensis TaxID=163869 RepID=UPI00037A0E21|nr:nicotinamide riboside transporter PnuC [Algicola sagamiensis]